MHTIESLLEGELASKWLKKAINHCMQDLSYSLAEVTALYNALTELDNRLNPKPIEIAPPPKPTPIGPKIILVDANNIEIPSHRKTCEKGVVSYSTQLPDKR